MQPVWTLMDLTFVAVMQDFQEMEQFVKVSKHL